MYLAASFFTAKSGDLATLFKWFEWLEWSECFESHLPPHHTSPMPCHVMLCSAIQSKNHNSHKRKTTHKTQALQFQDPRSTIALISILRIYFSILWIYFLIQRLVSPLLCHAELQDINYCYKVNKTLFNVSIVNNDKWWIVSCLHLVARWPNHPVWKRVGPWMP